VPSPDPLADEDLRVRVVRLATVAVPNGRRVAVPLADARRGVDVDVLGVATFRAGVAALLAAGAFAAGAFAAGAFAAGDFAAAAFAAAAFGATLRPPPSAAS
jgi:hypothetical protein